MGASALDDDICLSRALGKLQTVSHVSFEGRIEGPVNATKEEQWEVEMGELKMRSRGMGELS